MTMTEPSPAELARLSPTRGRGPVTRNYAVSGIEIRAADEANPHLVDFFGHASVTNRAYPMYGGAEAGDGGWDETVDRGAFKRTLGQNADVAFLLNHGGMTLARTKSGTLTLTEDKVGLAVAASLDTRMSVVNDITLSMGREDLDEMSFAFRVLDDVWLTEAGDEVPWWDMSGVQRHIKEVSLQNGDVSVVNFGANPFTDAGLRNVDLRQFAGALRELRAGAVLSAATKSVLMQVLELIAAADEATDAAQPLLAELLGVPNPDADDEGGEDDSMAGMSMMAAASPDYYANLAALHEGRRITVL